jgi:hypothetical protein
MCEYCRNRFTSGGNYACNDYDDYDCDDDYDDDSDCNGTNGTHYQTGVGDWYNPRFRNLVDAAFYQNPAPGEH